MKQVTQVQDTVSDLLDQLKEYRDMLDVEEGGHIEYTAYELDKCIKTADELHSMLLSIRYSQTRLRLD